MDTIKHKEAPEDHWYRIAKNLYKESGEIPDALQIRAQAIIDALEIPWGQTSAIGINEKGERVDSKADAIIAQYLTNKAGVVIDKNAGIVSRDFRDMYPNGLPPELRKCFDPRTVAIMDAEYEHAQSIISSKDEYDADCPIHFFRLPGGVDLFLRGYAHIASWQRKHGQFLKRANGNAEIIAIEGRPGHSLGESLPLRWGRPGHQDSTYDALMHDAFWAGFSGLFTEIDARDISKIAMDVTEEYEIPLMPDKFYQEFYAYLNREHPNLTRHLSSPSELKEALIAQSTVMLGDKRRILQGKRYYVHPYFSKSRFLTGQVPAEPTFFELGQILFSDALAAIKLHLIAKLMTDGHIKRGPIIDYEGHAHLSNKSFFLQYPQYAMEVVLRMVNELMAGKVREKGNINEIYEIFNNPNWSEIVTEIVKLAFKRLEDEPYKSTIIGPNQRQLIDVPVDYLEIYKINAEKIVPSAEKIQATIRRISASAANKKAQH